MKDGVDGFDVKNHFEKLFTEVVDDNPAATKVVLGGFFRGGELPKLGKMSKILPDVCWLRFG